MSQELRRIGCRGFALTAVIMMAVIFGIAAFGILTMALGARQRARFHEERLGARYAAEAALVWAQQQFWRDQTGATTLGRNAAGVTFPDACFVNSPDFSLDDDNNAATLPLDVDIVVTPNCAAANRQLSANVVYQPSP